MRAYFGLPCLFLLAAALPAQRIPVPADLSIFKDTLVEMSWPQVKESAQKHAIVLFPIGVVEEHGPHLDLSPDIYLSCLYARQVKYLLAAKGIDAVIAPPFYWGITDDTQDFPGSFTVRPETMQAVLRDSIGSLGKWGFGRVFLMNLHGNPNQRRTVGKVAAEFPDTPKVYDLAPLTRGARLNLPPRKPGAYSPDFHAGADETRMVWDYYPQKVNTTAALSLPPQPRFLPLGYAGDPARFMENGAGAAGLEALSRFTAERIEALLEAEKTTPKPAWVPKRDLPEARIFEIAAAIHGRIYAVTSGEDGLPGTEVHVYDPAADSWTKRAHANLVRHSFGAGLLDGKIYIWGGVAGNRLVDSCEMYDPAADRWTVRANWPRPRIFAKGAGVGHKLYAVGGILPPGRNQVPLIDEYDPQADRWTAKTSMPQKRDAYRVAVANDKVYVVGNLGAAAEVLEYDPGADRWTVKAAMPTPRFDFGIHAANGLIYTFGGMGKDTLEVYDAAADRWIARKPMPRNNWEQVAAEVDGKIYVIGGGFPAGSVLKTLYQYDPALDR